MPPLGRATTSAAVQRPRRRGLSVGVAHACALRMQAGALLSAAQWALRAGTGHSGARARRACSLAAPSRQSTAHVRVRGVGTGESRTKIRAALSRGALRCTLPAICFAGGALARGRPSARRASPPVGRSASGWCHLCGKQGSPVHRAGALRARVGAVGGSRWQRSQPLDGGGGRERASPW